MALSELPYTKHCDMMHNIGRIETDLVCALNDVRRIETDLVSALNDVRHIKSVLTKLQHDQQCERPLAIGCRVLVHKDKSAERNKDWVPEFDESLCTVESIDGNNRLTVSVKGLPNYQTIDAKFVEVMLGPRLPSLSDIDEIGGNHKQKTIPETDPNDSTQHLVLKPNEPLSYGGHGFCLYCEQNYHKPDEEQPLQYSMTTVTFCLGPICFFDWLMKIIRGYFVLTPNDPQFVIEYPIMSWDQLVNIDTHHSAELHDMNTACQHRQLAADIIQEMKGKSDTIPENPELPGMNKSKIVIHLPKEWKPTNKFFNGEESEVPDDTYLKCHLRPHSEVYQSDSGRTKQITTFSCCFKFARGDTIRKTVSTTQGGQNTKADADKYFFSL